MPITAHRLTITDWDVIEAHLAEYSELPYFYHQALERTSLWQTYAPQLQNKLQHAGFSLFGFKDGDDWVAIVGVEEMDWDKKHFGFGIARIFPACFLYDTRNHSRHAEVLPAVSQGLDEHYRERAITYVSVATEMEEPELTLAWQLYGGYQLIDSWVTWAWDFERQGCPVRRTEILIRDFDREASDEYAQVVAMSKASFEDNRDRFHNDPAFTTAQADELYEKWTYNSLMVYDRKALVAVVEGDGEPFIGGYITAKVHDEANLTLSAPVGELELAAVSSRARGRGLYTDLFIAGLQYLHSEAQVRLVHEKTQCCNRHVQNAWKSLGLRLIRHSYVLRKCVR